jgi:hypothetical protein
LEKDLALTVREAAIDHEALQTPLKPCHLSRCRAMCCHDGVFLGPEEQAVIARLLPGEHFEKQKGRTKTRTNSAAPDQLGDAYPAHFPKTRCTLLDDNHHCRLQSRSMTEGRHPWFWKPFPCWLHPLTFQKNQKNEGARPLLTLPTVAKESLADSDDPGFASCTTCGKADLDGRPAWQVLTAELTFLFEISGRDLLAELSAFRD